MTIFMMGDSTMKFNNYFTYPQAGWGQAMSLFVKGDVSIENYAENGRSTKSFIDELRFDTILNRMKEGDFVICCFGHNDEKIQDPARYTTPYGTYQENLAYFAREVEARGGHIVFATSIARHKFENGVCINTHGDYPQAMLDYAKSTNHTCIDLNKFTTELYNQLGEEASKKFHMIFEANRYTNYPNGKDDHSHLLYEGAVMVSQIFVREILKTTDPIKEVFIDLNQIPEIDWKMLID